MHWEIFVTDLNYVLGWLATADDRGNPNVSPKEIWKFDGVDRLLIANIASPTSARNILSNPSVCFSFVDVFIQKGLKLEGLASVVLPDSQVFTRLARPLVDMCNARFEIRSLFNVEVTDATPILAPSYLFHSLETREVDQRKRALSTYGVQSMD
jgi:predicted pyridoxine 5'-phosphate oxidase superfamily flavin-nucleotide-binding protein